MKKEYKNTRLPLLALGVVSAVFYVLILWLFYGLGYFRSNNFLTTKLLCFFFSIDTIAEYILIYKTEYIYWIPGGPTYETARDAGSAERKKFAAKFLKRTCIIFGLCVLYMVVSTAFNFSVWLDILLVGGVMILNDLEMRYSFVPDK
ncbi:MAG: hypothetical protein EOM30_04880 [Clostridia bacterium]|nr:hypothetical protein [Clostridia bacterium]NLS84744.1 hypothetical protein [Oscillospiraceae bacterium]